MNSKAMVKIPVLILAVLIWFQCNACVAYVVPGNTTPDDERYFDKEVRISILFSWFIRHVKDFVILRRDANILCIFI